MNTSFLLDFSSLRIKKSDAKQFYIDGKSSGIERIRETDNQVIMDVNDNYGQINNPCAIDLLSFFVNSGISVSKMLTYNGYYLPENLIPEKKLIIDEEKINSFDETYNKLKISLRSNDKIIEILKIYNHALCLKNNFIEESYLNFIRILDSNLESEEGAPAFAEKNISVLSDNFKNYFLGKIKKYKDGVYKENFCCIEKINCSEKIRGEQDKLFFCVLYSLYEFRNKYLHQAFSFPHKIKTFLNNSNNEDFNYIGLSSSEGVMFGEEYVRIEDKILNIDKNNKFKEEFHEFYIMLPTWHFLNIIVRENIRELIDKNLKLQ